MASPEPSPLKDYTSISDQIYVRQPDESATPGAGDPDVVVLYGWGDAVLKHVAKYADGFIALYPGVKMVLVLSPMIKTLSTDLITRAHSMLPVVDTVFGGAQAGKSPKVLMHAMSNTGGISLAATMYAYKELFVGTEKTLPYHMLSLDSTPGTFVFKDNVGAWSRGLAHGIGGYFPWPFFITQGISAVILGLIFGGNWLAGTESAAKYSTFAVNNPELSDLGAKRLYLYSKADDIIPWNAIGDHATNARAQGYDVTQEMFEDSAHVGHMRLYKDQYWNAISKVWSLTLPKSQQP